MCTRLAESINDMTPPLRIVLTSSCNGNCSFCHHEGNGDDGLMDPALVFECAEIAEKMQIPHISLTGGEPTLRTDLGYLISGIQSRYHGRLTLTTNGFALSRLGNSILKPLHTVNLSIVSFSQEVSRRYQNVNPFEAIQSLLSFPAINKNVNIVVVEENYQSITEIVHYCFDHSLPVHIMFELKDYSQADVNMQKYVMQELRKLGKYEKKAGTTPTLIIRTSGNRTVSIKHPKLSRSTKWNVCRDCNVQENCYERICAVRVYPNGMVTPCLNGHITFSDDSIGEGIMKAYKLFAPTNLMPEEICDDYLDIL